MYCERTVRQIDPLTASMFTIQQKTLGGVPDYAYSVIVSLQSIMFSIEYAVG